MSLTDEQLQELYAWIDEIPLSRPKRNITRDFSDGVLVAEVVHHFLPKLVELHNYVPANSSKQKMNNWSTLNMKVFKKLGLVVPDNVVQGVTNNKPGVIEVVLSNLRSKVIQATSGMNDFGYGGVEASSPGWGDLDPKKDKARPRHKAGSTKDVGSHKSPQRKASQLPGKAIGEDILNGPPYDEIDDPSKALMQRDQSIMEYQETVEILQVKVRKLEQLVRLKDKRIQELEKRLERHGLS